MTEIMISKVSGSLAFGAMGGSALFAITDAVSISIVTSISAVAMAGISAYFAYKAKTIAETTGKAVDGHLTEFKQMAQKTFTAEGVLKEKTDEKARQADATKAHNEGVAEQKEKQSGEHPIDSKRQNP